MKKLLKVLVCVSLFIFATTAVADMKKGQKVIIKMLKKDCGFNGADLAKKHTQANWKMIYDQSNLPSEIKTLCPNSKPLKEKYYPHVYDFLYNYALDSGNVPAC